MSYRATNLGSKIIHSDLLIIIGVLSSQQITKGGVNIDDKSGLKARRLVYLPRRYKHELAKSLSHIETLFTPNL